MSILDRYARQMRYPPIGEEGQRRLLASRALVCGCGALGSVIANTLARAGVGKLRIVDRDFLELNNLQRQVIYDEADVTAALPKAIAAAEKLRRINSEIEIEPVVADVSAGNILSLADGCDVIVDGLDNFETRFLINEAAVKLKLPWVYGGCIGAEGQTLTILPDQPPCFRCIMPEPPPPGSTPTCDTAGILGPAVNVVASIQACEAIKILAGKQEVVSKALTVIDLWDNRIRQLSVEKLRTSGGCATCGGEEFPWLSGKRGSQAAVLCGRNSVQLNPSAENVGQNLSLVAVADKLAAVGSVTLNKYLLRATIGNHTFTLFPDGRAIIGGTSEIAEARTLYAKYIGT